MNYTILIFSITISIIYLIINITYMINGIVFFGSKKQLDVRHYHLGKIDEINKDLESAKKNYNAAIYYSKLHKTESNESKLAEESLKKISE